MDEGEGGYGERRDRNEAISAVADEGFLGEEDDDYEDLYNDVNVGEGFFQSFQKNEDLEFKNEDEKKIESGPESMGVLIPGVGGGGERNVEKVVGASGVPPTLGGYQDLGFRGNEPAPKSSASMPSGGSGIRVELAQSSAKMGEVEGQIVHNSMPSQGFVQQSHGLGVGNEAYVRQGGGGGMGNVNVNGGNGSNNSGGGTVLFVGDLHWWTTDAELEAELSKYGNVKEVKFFDEKASGKSKGYCQVEFYDPATATACKEGMNGHIFNGRPCLVAYASPYSVRRMGEAQLNKNQAMVQPTPGQGRRGVGDAGGRSGGINISTGGNYQGGDGGRNYGRGSWGRGNAQGMGNRGQVGPMRNRIGGMGGRGIMGNGSNGFGPALAATPPLHPQAMMGQGFDPTYGAHMGRMGGYGGFPAAPMPAFSGMLQPFPHVGGVGLPGVAPHVNPAFFGRGMPTNGMGIMPTTGVEGQGMGMWSDPNAAGWGSEDPGVRAGDSSYGEDAASDHQYGDVSHERGGRPNAMREKDRGSERDWSGATDRRYRNDREPGSDRDIPREKDVTHDTDWSERRYRDNRETGRDRDRDRERDRDRDRDRDHDRYREERDRYMDQHRYRDRDLEYDNELDRGRSSGSHNKSRISREDDRRSRSRDVDYGKRRRLPSE